MSSLIKIASQAEILQFFKQEYGKRAKRIYGYFSSDFNKVITDEHLMLIPIDERMATRAHAVFDVIYAKKLKLINLQAHIQRLYQSSESVSVQPPMPFEQTKQVVKDVMAETLKNMAVKQGYTRSQLTEMVFGIRLTISSGHGDFGIASLNKKPTFYMSIFEPYINYQVEMQGVNEYVVEYTEELKEPSKLVHTKTVNYLNNALMANKCKQLGGYQGIKALKSGVLLEAAVANIAFIFVYDGQVEFATPRFETVIEGTTIKKLLKYISQLKEQGKIHRISFRDITIRQAQSNAKQMMVIGGDKIVPVLNFNGHPISQQKGAFTLLFQNWYEKQNEVSTPIFDNEQDF